MDWKTILVPTDFSQHSMAGVELALALARRHHAKLVVMHVVVDALPALLPDVAGFRYDDIIESLGQRAHENLPRLVAPEQAAGLEIEYRVAFGVPHAEIVAAAAEVGADLIVIATHGRSAAMHLLIGSVAEKVVRKAPCPVLVARKPDAAASVF